MPNERASLKIILSIFCLGVFMKPIYFILFGSGLLLTSCQNNTGLDQIVSQKYVHKYGFDVSEQEWEDRAQDGQEIAVLKNGVKTTRSYENGQLHGPTTSSFPNSTTVEKLLVYDQGILLKEAVFDSSGMPILETLYEFDDRNVITLWDEKGVPLSIEEYDNDLLVEGKYYTGEHILEAQVNAGYGERVKRDRSGLLISKDQVEGGCIAERATYHPSGETHTISHYHDYQLHGEQIKFTSTGKPLMKLNWNHGILDGTKVVYRNGLKVAEIPYINGQKHGIEKHYDDLNQLTAEIEWKKDKKHGCSKFFTDETTDTEWFFKGQMVSAEKFEILDSRDRFIADLSIDR